MNRSKEELFNSIHPDMKLDKAFLLRIYGDEITWPGYAEEAIQRLEDAGCSKAREYYDQTVAEYQRKRDEELRPIARQVRKQWEADWEELKKGSEKRRRIETCSTGTAQSSCLRQQKEKLLELKKRLRASN